MGGALLAEDAKGAVQPVARRESRVVRQNGMRAKLENVEFQAA